MKLWNVILFELRGMRVYKVFLFINLVLIPFSYAVVLLLGGVSQDYSYLLSGLVVASLVGTFVGLVAHRASNLVQPEVLELYAVLSARMELMVAGAVAAYALLVLPQVAVLIGLAIGLSPEGPRALLALPGTFFGLLFLALLGVFFGTLIRNPYKAQGLFPLLSFILLLAAPVYYKAESLPRAYVFLVLLNPLTHVLNVIRPPLGFPPLLDPRISLGLLGVVGAFMGLYVLRSLRDPKMLERFF
ncbi:MAG: ABC transporter permease [Thermofilaceae archaeon]